MDKATKKKRTGRPGWLKSTFFSQFLVGLKERPLLSLTIVLFDFLFLVSIYIIYLLLGLIAVKVVTDNPTTSQAISAAVIVFVAVLIVLAVYSLLKNLILNRLCNYHKRKDLRPLAYLKFFRLNVVVVVSIFLISFIFNLLMLPIAPPELTLGFSIFYVTLALLFFFFLYIFSNLLHPVFFLNPAKGIFWPMKEAVKLTYLKAGAVFRVILTDVLVFILFVMCFAIFGTIVRAIMISDPARLEAFNPTYGNIFLVMFLIVAYALFCFNRMSFFRIASR